MPQIDWATGEQATVDAARRRGQGTLTALGQLGWSVGTGASLYRDQVQKEEEEGRQDEMIDTYNRIDNQTAAEIQRDAQEARSRSTTPSTSAPVIADDATTGLDPGLVRATDPDQDNGVRSPGSSARDVLSSQQQQGDKPAAPTQDNATTNRGPAPATKDGSVEDTQDRGMLNRVATAVSKAPETVWGGIKAIPGKIADIAGSRVAHRLGNIIGIEDPLHKERLSKLAQFQGRGLVREEERKRASSLSGVLSGLQQPLKALKQGVAPFTYRNMDPDLETMQARPRGSGVANLIQMMHDAAAGDPIAAATVNQWMDTQGWLQEMKNAGRVNGSGNWENEAMRLATQGPTPEDQARGRWMLEAGQAYGLSAKTVDESLAFIAAIMSGRGMSGLGAGPKPPPLPALPAHPAPPPGAPGTPTPPVAAPSAARRPPPYMRPGAAGGGAAPGGAATGVVIPPPPGTDPATQTMTPQQQYPNHVFDSGGRVGLDRRQTVRQALDEAVANGGLPPAVRVQIGRTFAGMEDTPIGQLPSDGAEQLAEQVAAGTKLNGGLEAPTDTASAASTQPPATSTTSTTLSPGTTTTTHKMTPQEREEILQGNRPRVGGG